MSSPKIKAPETTNEAIDVYNMSTKYAEQLRAGVAVCPEALADLLDVLGGELATMAAIGNYQRTPPAADEERVGVWKEIADRARVGGAR